MDDAAALLVLLAHEDGMSIHKANKKLGLSMSEMMRLLATLEMNAELGGLGLIERQERGGRICLFLTEKGRAACAEM
jgi:DNA-binding IclR family transcriptional regulator